MEGYSVKITNSSRELTARERIKLKDFGNAVSLDEATQGEGKLVVTPVDWATLSVHNEKSDNKDYDKFVIIDEGGTKYVTGSESFRTAYMEIAEEMGDEKFDIEIYEIGRAHV